ncbi:hypothetical protein [Streptomyces sp. NBC_00454]|uniref:hypothetical protein n=1 Tax=Streptomyces sp. NBC_00454 TaxID=2975747 RepID=UPI0030E5881F
MDQGIAGLLGAAVGALAGGSAAVAAAWLGRNGMKQQAEAMVQQAERQAGAQSEQWKRTVLRDCCIAFADAARHRVHAVHRYNALLMYDQRGYHQDPDEIARTFYESGIPMWTAYLAVELEANDEIREAALLVTQASSAIPFLGRWPVAGITQEAYDASEGKASEMYELVGEFVRIVRQRLHPRDPEAPPPTPARARAFP